MAVPNLDPAKLQLVQELEIEMMSDMYSRLVGACYRKCIPIKFHEAELGKLLNLPKKNIFFTILNCVDRFMNRYQPIHKPVNTI